jgi:hypothetical protein
MTTNSMIQPVRNQTAPEWDMFSYMRDVRAHPENYVTMQSVFEDLSSIQRVRACKTLAELKRVFTVETRRAKGDADLLALLVYAKDQRKVGLA